MSPFPNDSLLPLDGLPAEIAARASAAFRALGCTESSLPLLTTTLVEIASLCGIRASVQLGQTFTLLVAASHSISSLSSPPPPFAHVQNVSFTVNEWLLLAARERSRNAFPPQVADSIDVIMAELARVSASSARTNAPILTDYGFGKLLAAVVGSSTEPSAIDDVGHLMGTLARLSFEIHRITSPEQDLSFPYILRDIATKVGLGPRLSLALALAGKPVPDKLHLVSVLGHRLVWPCISQLCSSSTVEAVQAVPGPVAESLRQFMTTTGEAVARKVNGVRLFGFAPAPALAPELDRAIRLAVDALEADPDLREAWEVQRWGGIFPQATVGRFFPLGLCTLALAAASVDVTERASKLVSLRETDGYRYFEGYSAIAPDTDDLGLALQLAALLPADSRRDEAFAWPIELMAKNTSAEGEIPVWLDRHLREPLAQDAPRWRGSRCLAVAANATIGLLESGLSAPQGLVERSIGWIIRTWRTEGMQAVFFYGVAYTQFVLVRLHEVASRQTITPASTNELRSIVDEITVEIVASQTADGGYGSVLDTACRLAALAIAPCAPFDPWPAVTYLAARQEYDGLWPREPLYPTPGKDHAPAAHGARSMTAAFCLYALARTRTRLKSEEQRAHAGA